MATLRRRSNIQHKVGLPTWPLHLFLLPGVILLLIYSYLPMLGIVIAFQNFDLTLGVSAFFESEWVGFQNFTDLFSDPSFGRALANTLVIANLKILVGFFIPIIFALMLNELRSHLIKRGIQTLIYLPHFLSWVIVAGMMRELLGLDGLVNNVAVFFGQEPHVFLGDKELFVPILIASNLWKEFGFSTIVYLAAITAVDPALYEAAMMDGANRWRQTVSVTLPAMFPIIILTAVLSLGRVTSAGFEQILNLYNEQVYEVADVIDTVIYRRGFLRAEYSFGAAFGLFNSIISFILIAASYQLARKWAKYEIF